MRGLFSRKKKEEIPDVEEPEAGKIKDDVDDEVVNSEGQTELFSGMETEDNGLFDDMESLNKNNNDILLKTGFDEEGEEYEEDDDDDEDDDDVATHPIEGMYDPSEFSDLPVTPEVKDLFDYIIRYIPQKIELDYKLKPFIPDFIPAVGDIDALIKVESDNNLQLGLTVLDEPSAKQSDPNIIELQLRSVTKTSSGKMSKIKKVSNIDKEIKVVDKWIKDIDDLHRSKPAPTIQYSKTMPEIDQLMQVWPNEIEALIQDLSIPSASLNIDLNSYVDILCSMLDIPIYKSRIQV